MPSRETEEQEEVGELRVVLTGGGTGGHVYPSLAIARKILSDHPDTLIRFIGSERGPEGEAAKRNGIDFLPLTVTGISPGNPLKSIKAMVRFLSGLVTCVTEYRRWRPGCVLSTGGFASAPASFAAVIMGIPLILHELNIYPGFVTRTLSSRATATALWSDETASFMPAGARCVTTGVPVREEIAALMDERELAGARRRGRERMGIGTEDKVLLVFGGSQGAEAMNRALWADLPRVQSKGIQVLHITGRRMYDSPEREEASQRFEDVYHAVPYCERMELAYGSADMVLSRAGAATLSEILIAGLPSVLVPYPFATMGHQEMNAGKLSREGACVMVSQDVQGLGAAVSEALALLDNEEARRKMSSSARSLARPKAVDDVVALMMDCYRDRT